MESGKETKKGEYHDSLKELLLQKETIHWKVDAETKQKWVGWIDGRPCYI